MLVRHNLKGIMAIGFNNIIAKPNGALSYISSADMKYFKKLTTESTLTGYKPVVIMGRKTYDSIGMLLQDRINIIITKKENYQTVIDKIKKENPYMEHLFRVCTSPEEAIYLMDTEFKHHDGIVIGGPTILEKLLPYISELHITHISKEECIYEEDSIYISDEIMNEMKILFNFEDKYIDYQDLDKKLLVSVGKQRMKNN